MPLFLVACGGGDEDQALPPSADKPAEQKQARLSRAEYPLMREFVISEPDDAAELQPICSMLDAGPDTPVIRAARNGCDRALSYYNEVESIQDDLTTSCTPGEFEACADAAEPLRQQFVNARRILVTYNDDIADVVASGPCREALQDKEQLEEFDRVLSTFDEALRELRRNNPEPFQDLDTETDSKLDDPTPCRPA